VGATRETKKKGRAGGEQVNGGRIKRREDGTIGGCLVVKLEKKLKTKPKTMLIISSTEGHTNVSGNERGNAEKVQKIKHRA